MSVNMMRFERWVLAGLLVVFLTVAGLYAWVTPPLEGFDADAYFLAGLHLAATGRLPELDATTRAASYELIAQPPLYFALSALAMLPWPVEPARAYVAAAENPYFDKSKSTRQAIRLPGAPWVATAPVRAAALVSLLGALLAVWATWRLARALRSGSLTFAVAATSVVAFNPQFLFMAVTVTNDAWAAGTVAMSVALAAEAALGHPRPSHPARRWLWVGVWVGLATLVKYSGFIAGLPIAVLWGLTWRRQGPRVALTALLWALAGGLIAAGWFYGRNVWLYGEIIPLTRMAQVLPTLNRSAPLPWEEVVALLPWLVWCYWGVFVATIAPPAYFAAARVLMLGGLAGLLPALWRRLGWAAWGWSLAALAIWALAAALAVIHWTRTVDYGAQGRLAHIAAPAFALLLVAGWQAWLPRRAQPWLHATLVASMIGLALWQSRTLAQAYGVPPALAQVTPDRPLAASFGGGLRLVGADLPAGAAAAPGATLPLTLYWTTGAAIPGDYTLFVHLATADDRLLAQVDGVPDHGRHPTRQWRPGAVFADTLRLTLAGDAPLGLATLSVGWYPIDDERARLPVTDATGAALGDRLVIARVAVVDGTPAPQPADPVAAWENGITLAQATVTQGNAGPTAALLAWWSAATLHQDYTLFVQVLDADNQVLAQVDQEPLAGRRPTSTWRTGDAIAETAVLPPVASGEWARVIAGWYGRDGARLRLTDGQDFLTLAERGTP
jgi:hypothetical protein